jgi:hypothetical protein
VAEMRGRFCCSVVEREGVTVVVEAKTTMPKPKKKRNSARTDKTGSHMRRSQI